jgi:putative photosynthetic complex assembly protein 2
MVMSELWLPIATTLSLWWFATGAILYLDGLPRRTFAWTFRGATVLLGLALWGLVHTRHDLSAAGAYCAFCCALLVWAWQEVAFLLGMVTGPRQVACPAAAHGWHRAWLALQTVAYHELALILLAIAVWACVGDGANRVGWWTYLALWLMRQSAKLNVLLGVRNLGESMLPHHLAYLATYFRRAAANWLWPLSIVLTSAAAVWVWSMAIGTPAEAAGAAAGHALVATLIVLGVLEHLFLVLPLPLDALWRWGLASRRPSHTTTQNTLLCGAESAAKARSST